MLNPHELLMTMSYLKLSSCTLFKHMKKNNSTEFCLLGHEEISWSV